MSKQTTLSSFLGISKAPAPPSPSKASSAPKTRPSTSNGASSTPLSPASGKPVVEKQEPSAKKTSTNVKKRKRVLEEDDEDFDPVVHSIAELDDDHIVLDADDDEDQPMGKEGMDLSEEEEREVKKGKKKTKTIDEDHKLQKLAHMEHEYGITSPVVAGKKKLVVEEDEEDDKDGELSRKAAAKKVSSSKSAIERKEARRLHGETIEAKLKEAQEIVDEERHARFSEVIVASVERARDQMLKYMSEEITGEGGEGDEGDEEEEEEEKPKKAKKTTSAKKSAASGPKYTPLELQYLEIRKQYPDSILFVESGYRYKFFGKDAEVAAKVLNIRAGVSNNFLSTSVPVHRLHVHALRLVQAGYKVGVVSQTETAALKAISTNKSGPFARAVSALYTKSTLVNESMDPLTSDSTSIGQYLMAIYESPAGASIGMKNASRDVASFGSILSTSKDSSTTATTTKKTASSSSSASEPSHLNVNQSYTTVEAIRIDIVAVKTSTGDIIYDSFVDGFLRTELETRLRHIGPIEIIMQEDASEPTKKMVNLFATGGVNKDDHVRVEFLAPNCFNLKHAKELIQDELTLFDESKVMKHSAKKVSGGSGNGDSNSHSILASLLKAKSESFFSTLDVSLTIAFGSLVDYLKRFGISSLICLSCNFNAFSNARRMQLDGNALYNLELLTNQQTGTKEGSLISIIDRTATSFGKRRLISWIRQPLVNASDIKERLDAVEEISKLAIPKFSSSVTAEIVDSSSPSNKASSSSASSATTPSSSSKYTPNTSRNGLGHLIAILPALPDLERGICRIFYNRCSVSEFISVLLGFREIERCMPKFDEIEACCESELLKRILKEIPSDLATHVSHFLDPLNIHSTDKQKKDLFVNDDLLPALREAKERQAEVEEELNKHLVEIRQKLGKPRLEYITKNKDEYVIEVTAAEGARAPKSWIPLASPASVARFHTQFIIEKYQELLQCRETLAIEISNSWATFVAEFASRYPIFRSTVETLATLDCLHSLSALAKTEGYVRPIIKEPHASMPSSSSMEISSGDSSKTGESTSFPSSGDSSSASPETEDMDTEITIINGRHPIVEHLLTTSGEGKLFVPNDTLMGVNTHGQKCTIITGPNMGGKTCYTRQVAVLCVMAQMGSFVPAESMTFSPLDAIHTRMGAYDNLSKGQSTFFVELQETSDIMRLATSRSLVILDELGRGTSTHDGFSIAYAALHHLLTVNKCFTLFVTHYPALSQLTRLFPNLVQNHHIAYLEQHTEAGDHAPMTISSEGEELTTEKATTTGGGSGMDVDGNTASLAENFAQLGPRITFLHKLVKGVEGRSFGMNVARMAQLPSQVILSASDKSAVLESSIKKRYSHMAFKKVVELALRGEDVKEYAMSVSRMLMASVGVTPSGGVSSTSSKK